MTCPPPNIWPNGASPTTLENVAIGGGIAIGVYLACLLVAILWMRML